MSTFEKIVIVTKKTALEELIERYNTREQARFYIEHLGGSFSEYEAAHEGYYRSLKLLRASLPAGSRSQLVDRGFLPNFQFGERDLVVTLGPDGLVVNTAKYLGCQPVLALNPDPSRIDGILIPFRVEQARSLLPAVLEGELPVKNISMAKAELSDGQVLYGVNDLFIGQKTHVSARYRIQLGKLSEEHSSSGLIVSTGAGSTGWLRSVLTGASAIIEHFLPVEEVRVVGRDTYRFDWEADYLYYSVREPFVSRVSSANLVFGRIEPGKQLVLESRMPHDGVIFSDGVEEDYLQFNSGVTARIGLAEKKVRLIYLD
jgi:NAD kinase